MCWNNVVASCSQCNYWKEKKIVQFVFIVYLLNHGCPMTNVFVMKKLYVQMDVFNNPKKHWSNGAGWEMANLVWESVK